MRVSVDDGGEAAVAADFGGDCGGELTRPPSRPVCSYQPAVDVKELLIMNGMAGAPCAGGHGWRPHLSQRRTGAISRTRDTAANITNVVYCCSRATLAHSHVPTPISPH